jgi:hypothetical protein
MATFWMIYVEGRTGCTHKHTEYEGPTGAKTEAERLALQPQNLGRNVYILQAIDYVVVEAPVKWHRMDDLPF